MSIMPRSMYRAEMKLGGAVRISLQSERRPAAAAAAAAEEEEEEREHRGLQASARVHAFCRIRPLLPSEASKPQAGLDVDVTSSTIRMTHMGRDHVFQLDRIFDANSTQQSVYDEGGLNSIVASVVTHSRNTCIFAYGCTGTGKTFTMQSGNGTRGGEQKGSGVGGGDGVIPRALRQLLGLAEQVNELGRSSCEVLVSYMQLYNDKLYDLLAPEGNRGKDLPIREDHENQIHVPGLSEVPVSTYEAFEALYTETNAQRKTATTLLNTQSSRSHAVLSIKVVHRPDLTLLPKGVKGGGLKSAKLHLIDLAGSERNSKTGNVGERLQESSNINMSLFTLGKVIDGLNAGDARVPFRDSKLTRLLQDSLGGSASHAIMICCVAPTLQLAGETCHALSYASKARSIVNKPKPLHPGDASYFASITANPAAMRAKLEGWRQTHRPCPPQQQTQATHLRTAAQATAAAPARAPSHGSLSTAADAVQRDVSTTRPPFVAPFPVVATKRKRSAETPGANTTPSSATPQASYALQVYADHRDNDKENVTAHSPGSSRSGAAAAHACTKEVPSGPSSKCMRVDPEAEKHAVPEPTPRDTDAPRAPLPPPSPTSIKNMIIQAKQAEKAGQLTTALRLYQAVHFLLPGQQKLAQRLQAVQRALAAQGTRAHKEKQQHLSLSAASVSPSGAAADMLHSAMTKGKSASRGERFTVSMGDASFSGMNDSTMMVDMHDTDHEYHQREDFVEEGDAAPVPAKLECFKNLHKEMRNVLEAELLDIINEGTRQELLALHGIGKKRAEAIMQMREAKASRVFCTISDLSHISMSRKQITSFLEQNMKGRLDVIS